MFDCNYFSLSGFPSLISIHVPSTSNPVRHTDWKNRFLQRRICCERSADWTINAPRDSIMIALRELDSDGAISRRKNRLRRRNYRSLGPNHIWHADGCDKLKPFGFPIHACIDVYSRKMPWLSVLSLITILLLYLRFIWITIGSYAFCPYCVRTDSLREKCPSTEFLLVRIFL